MSIPILATTPLGGVFHAIVQLKHIPSGVRRSSGYPTPAALTSRFRGAFKPHVPSKTSGEMYAYVKISDLPDGWHLAGSRDAVKPTPAPSTPVPDMVAALGPTPTQMHQTICDIAAAITPPKPRLYDGRTAEWCLERYTMNMRSDSSLAKALTSLTEAQKMAAQDLWRKTLLAKQTEAQTKERNRVVVDRDFEEWE